MIRSPDEDTVRRFIASQQGLSFTYPEVGATKADAPAGYVMDHNRQLLGNGELTYERAVAALRSWKQFNLGWVKVRPENAPIAVGTTVAVQATAFGLWSLNACRIVYLLEHSVDFKARFGFAYGTLPAHAECGEERFTIEWHRDDSVWYDLCAFSRPQQALVRLGYAYARRLQKRFARESLAAMAASSNE
jgi:uncharacterized protein (UPF0548 family)